jgi:hypothetical protein
MTVWRGMPHHILFAWLAAPGQVCLLENGDPVIACGRGMLRLLEYDIAGADAKARHPLTLRSRLADARAAGSPALKRKR